MNDRTFRLSGWRNIEILVSFSSARCSRTNEDQQKNERVSQVFDSIELSSYHKQSSIGWWKRLRRVSLDETHSVESLPTWSMSIVNRKLVDGLVRRQIDWVVLVIWIRSFFLLSLFRLRKSAKSGFSLSMTTTRTMCKSNKENFLSVCFSDLYRSTDEIWESAVLIPWDLTEISALIRCNGSHL